MKTIVLIVGTFILSVSTSAVAQEAPNFFKNTYPEYALKSALQARGVLEGKDASLDPKTRELIALGVSAQIPCAYCVYGHTKNAHAHGATEAEIREAVATAATVRQWSTVLNGMQYDLEAFKAEIDRRRAAN
jgi:AhpD family alkylhydroperoxidase